jgi:FolB domain-containing protein
MAVSVPSHFPYALTINQLALYVRLGITEQERSTAQTIHLDIHVFYPEPPKSMDSDGVNYDCYDMLAKHLQQFVDDKEFQLIEYLGPRLFEKIRERIIPPTAVWMKITKLTVNPNIKGGSSFILSDVPLSALTVAV